MINYVIVVLLLLLSYLISSAIILDQLIPFSNLLLCANKPSRVNSFTNSWTWILKIINVWSRKKFVWVSCRSPRMIYLFWCCCWIVAHCSRPVGQASADFMKGTKAISAKRPRRPNAPTPRPLRVGIVGQTEEGLGHRHCEPPWAVQTGCQSFCPAAPSFLYPSATLSSPAVPSEDRLLQERLVLTCFHTDVLLFYRHFIQSKLPNSIIWNKWFAILWKTQHIN